MKDINLRLFAQLFEDVAIIPTERGLPVQGREGDAYTLDVTLSSKQVDDYRLVRIGENHHAGGDFVVTDEGVRAIIPSIAEMDALHLAEEVKDVLLEFADSCRLDFPCSLADVQAWGEDILDEDPGDIERRYRALKGEPPKRAKPGPKKQITDEILDCVEKFMREDEMKQGEACRETAKLYFPDDDYLKKAESIERKLRDRKT